MQLSAMKVAIFDSHTNGKAHLPLPDTGCRLGLVGVASMVVKNLDLIRCDAILPSQNNIDRTMYF